MTRAKVESYPPPLQRPYDACQPKRGEALDHPSSAASAWRAPGRDPRDGRSFPKRRQRSGLGCPRVFLLMERPDQTPAGLSTRWRGEDVRLRRPKRQGGRARAPTPSAGRGRVPLNTRPDATRPAQPLRSFNREPPGTSVPRRRRSFDPMKETPCTRTTPARRGPQGRPRAKQWWSGRLIVRTRRGSQARLRAGRSGRPRGGHRKAIVRERGKLAARGGAGV